MMAATSLPLMPKGGVPLLVLMVLLCAGLAAGVLRLPSHTDRGVADPESQRRLHQAGRALILWAGPRLTQASDAIGSVTPPGFLPYPDRNADGNYDGTSDCLSGTGLARHEWRVGKLPFVGERFPCEGRDAAHDEDRADAGITARRAMDSLEIRDDDGQPLWYAASVNVLDDDVLDHYPDVSVSALLSRGSGWLTVCGQDGSLITRDAAFVVVAPGPPLAGQSRTGAAPGREHFLDAFSLRGAPPCDDAAESNADTDTVFIRATHGYGPSFNDQLIYVGRDEYVSALAIAQARQLATILKQGSSFPFAAAVDSTDGRCVPGLLNGRLPVRDEGLLCAGMSPVPAYLLQGGVSGAYYRQLHYSRNAAGDEAYLSFDQCAIRFTVHSRGLSYAPIRC